MDDKMKAARDAILGSPMTARLNAARNPHMRKYLINVSYRNREPDSPVEYADTLAEAKKIRTRMARGCGLFSSAINITRNVGC